MRQLASLNAVECMCVWGGGEQGVKFVSLDIN